MEVFGISEQNQTKFLMEKDEQDRESSRVSNTPMGDFEYDDVPVIPLSSDCSSSDFSEGMPTTDICKSNEKFMSELKGELHRINTELNTMIQRIDNTQEDILRRRDFCRDMERLSVEYNKQFGRENEQSEKIECLIDNLRVDIRRRDESLENLKFLESTQLAEHLRRNKSETVFTSRESDAFVSSTS
ncbi:hypothetical protein WA026_017878 [Henosepilachna vigintioctopunctata]|uniref:Uncharacterized protein n=1 Tax=Henosepilachna vigintioctopunctata TaxID=420089 RepID=A0AAW1TX68_9CUCU